MEAGAVGRGCRLLHLHGKAKKWEPDLGFLNSAKGAVIWPPGYLHETSTLPPPDAWQ